MAEQRCLASDHFKAGCCPAIAAGELADSCGTWRSDDRWLQPREEHELLLMYLDADDDDDDGNMKVAAGRSQTSTEVQSSSQG